MKIEANNFLTQSTNSNLMVTKTQQAKKRNIAKFDYWLLLSTLILTAVGIVVIYDASIVTAFRDFGDKLYFFKNQLAWATLGLIALPFFVFFDYHKLIKYSHVFLIGAIVLLITVFIPHLGTEILGAKRWLTISNFTFQPSEFTKLAIIFYATSIMSKLHNFKIRILDAAIVYFLPISLATILVILQPDLGTALIFIAITFVIYFAGNAPIWHFLLTLPIFIIGVISAILIKPYRMERLKAFLDPNYDPLGASYQINQIIIALSSGGVFGVGLGGAKSKFEFVPEIHNDAIFALIVEEIGFIGGVILIGVFLFLITRAIKIAKDAPDFTGKLLAIGIAGLLASQSLLNLASVVALIPLTGIPLPFISYGGSSLFVTLLSIGILLNIKKQS